MAEVSDKRCKGSSSSDAFLSGESTGPVGRPSVGRAYPTGMGLRPKACPRSRNATVTTTRDDRPIQGPVDRCLTLVRAMNTDTTGDDRVDPADPIDASVGAQNTSTSDPDMGRLEPRPGSLPAGTEHSQGGMCCPLCPNVGCLASRAVLPVIAPWGGTSSDWQMTILRTFVFIMISMSFMVSRIVRGEVSRLVISVGSYRNAWQLFV